MSSFLTFVEMVVNNFLQTFLGKEYHTRIVLYRYVYCTTTITMPENLFFDFPRYDLVDPNGTPIGKFALSVVKIKTKWK